MFCTKCKKELNESCFYLFEGKLKSPCKQCKLLYQKIYSGIKAAQIIEYKKIYYKNNKSKIILNQLTRDLKRKNLISQYQKIYRRDNKYILRLKKRKYIKNKLLTDTVFKLRASVSKAINQSLKEIGLNKNKVSCFSYLIYSAAQLKEHLEKLFEPWMSWQNHGTYRICSWNDYDPLTWTWQIDHIIPQSNFHFSSIDDLEFQKCWALENLRPYSAKQNIIDGARPCIVKKIKNII